MTWTFDVWAANDGFTTRDDRDRIRRRIARVGPRWWEVDDMDPAEQIESRQHIDRVLAELVAASRSGADAATVRRLAEVRLEQLDEDDVLELALLAAGLYAEIGYRNLRR